VPDPSLDPGFGPAPDREEILWYRPEWGAWEVGLLTWNDDPEPRMHLVIVDPRT
jgi:hypothetical protein